MKFGDLLLLKLREFNITQSQLSRDTGIPKTTISGWLNAGRLPDYSSLRALCAYFNVSADELLMTETYNDFPKSLNISTEETYLNKQLIRSMTLRQRRAAFPVWFSSRPNSPRKSSESWQNG